MRKPNRLWLAVALVVGLLTGASALAGSAAASSAVPWNDPNAVGYIGFCDTNGHQVRSGSTLTYPFAKIAVSSTAPPAGYGKPYGRAVLYAYQPLQYVDPADWSGMQMTGASAFSNDKAPMTQGLGRDHSLFNLNAAYPLHWDGLAQFRIYYTSFNKPEFETTYPAAVVKLTGKTWTQVGGGTVDCKAGHVASNELVLPNPTLSLGPANATSPSKGAKTSGTGSAGSTNAPGSSSTGAQSSGVAASKSSHRKSSSNAGLIVVLVLVVAVIAAGGFWARRRGGSATG